jgi:hypothetical protein
MRRFGNGSKHIAGALLLSAVFAGVASIATTGFADGASFSAISVNRTHKGDRLSQASNLQRPEINSNSMKAIPSTRVPPGCDPAFSPVADPERGRIFGRCVT